MIRVEIEQVTRPRETDNRRAMVQIFALIFDIGTTVVTRMCLEDVVSSQNSRNCFNKGKAPVRQLKTLQDEEQ